MKLFIAEKPSLGLAIAESLNGEKVTYRGKRGPTHIVCGGCVVTWCFGHVYELLEPQEYDEAWGKWRLEGLPIVPHVWKRKPKGEARDQIKVIKALLAKASCVIHAGDPDREGQLLVDEVLEELGNTKPVQRLWLSATDEVSVRKALASLKDNRLFRPLRDSAEARSWGDWLVGMNATRRMTLASQRAGVDGVVSVGRVQTPTLALVVRRDHDIRTFRSKAYYTIHADLKTQAGQVFGCRWLPGSHVPVDEAGRVLDRSAAEAVATKIAGKNALVEKVETKEKAEAPPLPFSLASLQMEANRRLGLSAQETLEVAQELYEAKLTSYPRTDCGYLPQSQHASAAATLAKLRTLYPEEVSQADSGLRSLAWNDTKVTAHHGIVPTGVTGQLEGRRRAVYDLVVRRYLAQFYKSQRYLETVIELKCEGEKLSCKGQVILTPGWKVLFARPESSADEEAAGTLPATAVGAACVCQEAVVEAKKTTAPLRYTEASLLAAMLNIHQMESDPALKKLLKDTAGIGTPATRAGIIETLKRRRLIEEKGQALVSTAKGEDLIAAVPESLKSPGLTGVFEQMLEAVAAGEMGKEDFLRRQIEFVTGLVKAPQSATFRPTQSGAICKACGRRMVRRNSSAGKFWGCSGYPTCRASAPDAQSKRRRAAPSPARRAL